MSILLDKFKALPTERKAFCMFIPVMVMALFFSWYSPANLPVEQKVFAPAAPIKGTDVPKVEKKIKKGTIKVIPKGTVEKKVTPLPPEIKNNDAVEVMDTAEVPPSEWGHKVISSINTDTGDTSLYVKENTPDLFAFESKKVVGAAYGYSTSGTVAEIYGSYQFLRVGNVHVGIRGEVIAETMRAPEAKILGTAEYRWGK
jgi:hypothetical protein